MSEAKAMIGSCTCPPGAAKLLPLSRVLVRQKMTVFKGNKYVVTDPDGEVLFYAKETGGVMLMSAKSRPFHINIHDAQDNEVMTLRRPYTFGPDKMKVCIGGQLVSVVRQEFTFTKPVLQINDANDQPVLRVKGPVVTGFEPDYVIQTADKRPIGVIKRVWRGWRTALTDADSFHLEFPVDLDVRFKAAIIGTCFLIDYLYFEN
ncbi:phospholipid scramblase 3-like [Ostrinia nubilalis]|uniref:phospholipid scramblase 3-like n=1 Tax=Ostrinia furnacalis TaxID=93504 RepID=UPI00103AD8BC|nr:phospholipid scramblase 3-like [Ostrinia furnacalis]